MFPIGFLQGGTHIYSSAMRTDKAIQGYAQLLMKKKIGENTCQE